MKMNKTAMEIERKVITVKEAAAAMCISTSAVYNLIKEGKLECVHIGRTIRIPIANLNTLVGFDIC